MIEKAIDDREPSADGPADHVPQRLLFALECIDGEGLRFSRVKKLIVDKFKVHERTAEDDIRRAYQVLSDAVRAEAPHLADKVTAKLWDVAVKAEAAADALAEAAGTPGVPPPNYGPCIAALAQLAKISGAHAPNRIEVTDMSVGERMRTTDQRTRIHELLKKARAHALASKAAESSASPDDA